MTILLSTVKIRAYIKLWINMERKFPSETQTEFLPFFLRFQENMRFMMNEQERGRDNA